jgi:hypothetical protein
MFPYPDLWDEMGFSGYECANCGEHVVKERQWADLPLCPGDGFCVRVRDLFAIHTKSLEDGIMSFIRGIPEAPSEVMLARDLKNQRHLVCRRGAKTRVWDFTRRTLAFLKNEDLPDTLINYATLPDDNG